MIKNRIEHKNRKASYEYTFIRELEAGIQLIGPEVKSIRNHGLSFIDSYCQFEGNELYVYKLNIAQEAINPSFESLRKRKLLLRSKELIKLQKDLDEGMTIIPYKFFENQKGIFKLQIALAKGKKLYDKRESIKKKDIEREAKRDLAGK
jgi:SsrA-binding protein